jgi:hypothetical protein
VIEAKPFSANPELRPALQIGRTVPTIPLQARRMSNQELRIIA